MLIKAKQEVDNAMKMLFPKESTFYNYSHQNSSASDQAENVVTRAANQKSTDILESSMTKVGQLNLVVPS